MVNVRKVESVEDFDDNINFPSVQAKDLVGMGNGGIEVEEIQKDDSDDLAVVAAGLGLSTSLNKNFIEDFDVENTSEPVNAEDKKVYGVSAVKLSKNKLSVRSNLGITTPVKVALHHSGFMYVTGEVGTSDENSLLIALSELYKDIAIKTSGFSYSSDALAYDDVVVDFISTLVEGEGWCSLSDIPEGNSMWDYVDILDIPTVYLNLVKAINPSSFRVLNACKNVVKIVDIEKDETPKSEEAAPTAANGEVEMVEEFFNISNINGGKSEESETVVEKEEPIEKTKRMACNTIISSDVIPDSLLRVVNNRVNLPAIKKTKVSVKDLPAYKESVGIKGTSVTVEEFGKTITFNINSCSVSKYLIVNTEIIEELTSAVDSILLEEKEQVKQLKISELFDKDKLLKYIHFIESADIDGVPVTSTIDIVDLVKAVAEKNDSSDIVVDAIKDFINKSTVSVVGIAEYVCDKCKKEVKDEESPIRSIIPLNMQQLFFDLTNLKYQ